MALPGLAPRALRSAREVVPACRACRRTFASQTFRRPRMVAVAPAPLIESAGRPARRAQTGFVSSLQQRRLQSSTASPAPQFYSESQPGRTALFDLHLEHGAKMVPFGGYSMPVQYSDLSITESHNWTREKCSLFDVGHMVQYHCDGPGAESFLETVTPSGLKDLAPGQSTLSALLHPVTGGIVDDCLITRLEEGPKHLFYVVTNAGNRQKDYDFFSAAIEKWSDTMNPYVQLRHLEADGEAFGLVALQGPLSAEILGSALSKSCQVDISKWYFGNIKYITLALPSGESLPIVASRGGYTGEDGFELSIPPSQTVEVTQQLLKAGGEGKLRLAGLGARDSLRLEAGMCLYGHDIDDSTTPPEAALNFIIPKNRRTADDIGFHGAETIIPQLTPVSKGGKGVSRRRIGLIVEGAPAREGAEVLSQDGKSIGTVTSGCPSPTLKKNVAMAYVEDGMHKSGTEVQVKVRGKNRKATVTKMPFVPNKFYRGAM